MEKSHGRRNQEKDPVAARPAPDHDHGEVLRMLPLKYPDAPPFPLKMPNPDEVRLFRVTPMVISLLDYTKGFGPTDLVTC
jgi:hypothetical protein